MLECLGPLIHVYNTVAANVDALEKISDNRERRHLPAGHVHDVIEEPLELVEGESSVIVRIEL